MPLLVKRNVRAIGSNELLGPVLEVEKIEFVRYAHRAARGRTVELFHLEDGSCKRFDELVFVHIDEDLLIAMRMEAAILEKDRSR
jgi:hypothetical protein